MGSSGGSPGYAWAWFGVLPVSVLLLFWFVAAGWNVTSKSRRRQRLQNAINWANRDVAPAEVGSERVTRGSPSVAVTGVERKVDRSASYRDHLQLDLELAEERRVEQERERSASSSRENLRVIVEDNGDENNGSPRVGEINNVYGIAESVQSEGRSIVSDKDSAFDPVVETDPRRSIMLNYVRTELSELSDRYDGMFQQVSESIASAEEGSPHEETSGNTRRTQR